jgi:hypothetical protein
VSWWVLGLADVDLAHVYFTCDGVGDEGGAIAIIAKTVCN